MAEYVFSEVFFKGNKQAVVDFLNRGLKGAEVAVEAQEYNEMTTFEGTLKRAWEGNALSQNLLGLWILYSELPEGVEVDEDPFELIRLSAEQGFVAAQYNMGVIYEMGYIGIDTNTNHSVLPN